MPDACPCLALTVLAAGFAAGGFAFLFDRLRALRRDRDRRG